VTSADQHHRVVPVAIERRRQPLQIGSHLIGKCLDLARRGTQQIGYSIGHQRSEVDAVGVGLQRGERQAVWVGAEPVAERPGAEFLGALVDRRCRESVTGSERRDEGAVVEQRAEAVRRRVAEIDRARIASMRLQQRHQPGVDGGERLVPFDLDELAVALDDRLAEPIGVVVEMAQRRTLGADEPAGEHIVAVTPDALDAVALGRDLECDLEPTPGLAQRAGSIGLASRRDIGVGAHDSPGMVGGLRSRRVSGRVQRSMTTARPRSRRRRRAPGTSSPRSSCSPAEEASDSDVDVCADVDAAVRWEPEV